MNKVVLALAIFAFCLTSNVLMKETEDKDRELASINLGTLLGNLLGGSKNTTNTTSSTPATNTTNTTKPANSTGSSNSTSSTPVANNTSSNNSSSAPANNTSSTPVVNTTKPANSTGSSNSTSSTPIANNTSNNTSSSNSSAPSTNSTNTTKPANSTSSSNSTSSTPVANNTSSNNTTSAPANNTSSTPVVNNTQPVDTDDSDEDNSDSSATNTTSPTNTTTAAPAPVKYAKNDVNMATFKDDCIRIHNDQRRYVGLNDLTWSDSLAASAQAWAENMAKNGFRHSGKTGENIASTSYSTWTLDRLFGMWTKEITHFIVGCKYPACSTTSAEVGHYTQMVWHSTTQVGCGFAPGYNRGYNYLCCQYYKAGNIVGQYVY